MPYPALPIETFPSLDIQDRTASIAMPTSAAVIIMPTVAAKNLIGYDPATGIITLPETRTYSTFLMLNCNTSTSRSVYTYVELDTGAGFVASRYSGRMISINGATQGQVVTVSRNLFAAGTRLRFNVWASGAMNAVTSDLPGLTGIATVPAYRLLISS